MTYNRVFVKLDYPVELQRKVAEGVAMAQEGLIRWRATGAKTVTPKFLAFLAECFKAAKQFDKALALVVEALSVSEKIEDRFYSAELHRLKGWLLLGTKNAKKRADTRREAEQCFLLAIETARRQQSKFLMLRSVLSLYNLWKGTDKQNRARALLRSTYESYTEAFDTPELKAAKELLSELA